MKITEKDFGNRFRTVSFDRENWFMPLCFNPLKGNKSVVGVLSNGSSAQFDCNDEWFECEEKPTLMSPGILKQGDTIFWSEHEFSKTIPLKIVITNAKITNNFLVDKNVGEIEGDLWILVKEYRK